MRRIAFGALVALLLQSFTFGAITSDDVVYTYGGLFIDAGSPDAMPLTTTPSKVDFSTVGEDVPSGTASAVTDDIDIVAPGFYYIGYSVNLDGSNSQTYQWAIFIDGVVAADSIGIISTSNQTLIGSISRAFIAEKASGLSVTVDLRGTVGTGTDTPDVIASLSVYLQAPPVPQ